MKNQTSKKAQKGHNARLRTVVKRHSVKSNISNSAIVRAEIEVDKKTITNNEEAIRQMQNDIYKVAQIYFECVGEHEGYLYGNGHHMAQELCEKAREIWVSRQNIR